jgi:hypothetical protein
MRFHHLTLDWGADLAPSAAYLEQSWQQAGLPAAFAKGPSGKGYKCQRLQIGHSFIEFIRLAPFSPDWPAVWQPPIGGVRALGLELQGALIVQLEQNNGPHKLVLTPQQIYQRRYFGLHRRPLARRLVLKGKEWGLGIDLVFLSSKPQADGRLPRPNSADNGIVGLGEIAVRVEDLGVAFGPLKQIFPHLEIGTKALEVPLARGILRFCTDMSTAVKVSLEANRPQWVGKSWRAADLMLTTVAA